MMTRFRKLQQQLPWAERAGARTAEEHRDQAIARVGENAAGWVARALVAVQTTAAEMPEFTTDDIRQRARVMAIGEPHEPRAWGAVMVAAVKDRKLCIKTGKYRSSRRPECHARPIPVYRSLIRTE